MKTAVLLVFCLIAGCFSAAMAAEGGYLLKGTDFLEANEGFSTYDEMAVIRKKADSVDFVMKVNIAESGEYIFKIVAAAYTEYSDKLSPVSISVDGKAALSLESGFSHSVSKTDRMFTQSLFEMKNKISLSSGEHEIKFTGVENGGGVSFGINTLSVEKYVEPLPEGIIVSGNTRVEAEDALESPNIKDNSALSGGKGYIAFGTEDEEAFEISFYLPKDGTYNINIAASCSATGAWLSPLSYKIDGGAKKEIDKNVPSIDKGSLSGNVSALKMAIYRISSDTKLEKGWHKIALNVGNRSQDGGGIYSAIDYIDFKIPLDYSALEIGSEEKFVEIGKSIALGLYSGGVETDQGDLFATLDYNVPQSGIAKAENGRMSGLNYGYAEAALKLKGGDEIYNYSSGFYVTDKNGLAVLSAKKSGDSVSVRVKAFKDYTAEDYLMIYIYGADGTRLSSVKAEYKISLSDMSAGEEKEYVQTVSQGTGDKINVILYNNASEYHSVYSQSLID